MSAVTLRIRQLPAKLPFTTLDGSPVGGEACCDTMNRSREALQARVDEMTEQCRNAGMNVTPQRIAIYRALLQSEEHPTPETLFRVVSRKMPSLSLATIYKTLDAFEEVGLIRAVPVVSEKRRYDANVDPH